MLVNTERLEMELQTILRYKIDNVNKYFFIIYPKDHNVEILKKKMLKFCNFLSFLEGVLESLGSCLYRDRGWAAYRSGRDDICVTALEVSRFLQIDPYCCSGTLFFLCFFINGLLS